MTLTPEQFEILELVATKWPRFTTFGNINKTYFVCGMEVIRSGNGSFSSLRTYDYDPTYFKEFSR